jgi:membrane protease YdiL (CAAX protease family)
MIKSRTFLTTEFLVLFVLLPLSLAAPILVWIKVAAIIIGFGYLLMVLRKFEGVRFRINKNIAWASFFKRVGITLTVIAIITSLFVWNTAPEELFYVPLNNPLLWVIILFFYSVLSVWPQEIIYRTFFFERYAPIFKNTLILVLVNAIVFSLAHLFFRNILVIVFTFIGGIIFGLTYVKYKSTTLVSIEHALYGNWLFTVGMGKMLAFPGMEESPSL